LVLFAKHLLMFLRPSYNQRSFANRFRTLQTHPLEDTLKNSSFHSEKNRLRDVRNAIMKIDPTQSIATAAGVKCKS
jgi:hypothetical protein